MDNFSDQREYRQSESGNVFWYIFLCIALLGTLTYAISHSGRSSITTLTEDKQELLAAEIVSYADIVGKAVTQLRLRGTTVAELSFANTFLSAGEYGTYNSDPYNEIFNPEGGAVVYTAPAEQLSLTANAEYMFLSGNEVEQIGTTCGSANCVDLIMVLNDIHPDICLKINNLIGVTNPGDNPPQDTDINEATKYIAGSGFSHEEVLGDEDSALTGQSEGCFEETSEMEYVYYKVLWAR